MAVQHDRRQAVPAEFSPAGNRRKRIDVVVFAVIVALVAVLQVGAVTARRDGKPPEPVVRTIRMAGDSEYFTDPAVLSELENNGFLVKQDRTGTRRIAELPDLATNYDVANAGSDNAAQHIITVLKDRYRVDASRRSPFSSPMVIVTHQPIIVLLEKLGIAHRSANGTWVFRVSVYLDYVKQQKQWNDIVGNEVYHSTTRILIATTDPTQSNSGGMLMAIETYVANGDKVVTEVDAFRAKPGSAELIRSTFTDLGTKLGHTPDLLALFLRDGMNRYPMGLFYEKDYINTKLNDTNALDEVVLMYPDPTVTADNTFVWWGQNGQDFANLLSTNTTLIRLAEQHGYHARLDPSQFAQDMANRGVTIANLDDPRTEVTVAPLPTEENLAKLIAELSK